MLIVACSKPTNQEVDLPVDEQATACENNC
jgi:hypothetical protein